MSGKWRFAVDRGGTFTDVVGVDPQGVYHTCKLLSSSVDYADPCVEGIRRLLGLGRGEPLPTSRVEAVRLGTTTATNALLERKGSRVALFITKGFRDLLEIGHQSRPDIFSLCIRKPEVLYSGVFEVDERVGPDGTVEKPIDAERLCEDIAAVGGSFDAVAVVLLHSWKNPAHELECERLLKERGVGGVYLSHKSVNLIKAVTRGQSTLVDAYLGIVLARYIEAISSETGDVPIQFMESSGTLSPPGSFTGRNAVLSGPAGGVIAVASLAGMERIPGAIGFDMGGTSTDVSRYGGALERVYEQLVGGVEIQGSALSIATVASGGGSVLWFDGERMRVGPDSAGAVPGPACYGAGGPLAITDANVLTGRISPGNFPAAFGPGGDRTLDAGVVREKFVQLTGEINKATGRGSTPEETALGFLRIANEKMALAIKEISVARGFDVRRDALVCFGGAGGQHACAIADLLGIDTVVFHPLAGVMSAYGIGLASEAKSAEKTVLKTYSEDLHGEAAGLFSEMESALIPGEWNGAYRSKREIDLRPLGADTYITVGFKEYASTLYGFRDEYTRLFGFYPADTPVEAVNLRVEVTRSADFLPPYESRPVAVKPPEPVSTREVLYQGEEVLRLEAPVYERDALAESFAIQGPAVIVEPFSTLMIDPGFEATVTGTGLVVAKRAAVRTAANAPAGQQAPDPVLLEVFNNTFMGVAAEMGHTLRNTAHSVNIKERLDFSCAVFSSTGDLVANAPHIPVHLGAMADTVKAVMEDNAGVMSPGDVFISNNPYRGGSHLPDVTVVEPVFSENGAEVLFFVAARGHHADIGGVTPGSMPPRATHIDEEGVLLDGVLIAREGRFMEEELRRTLSAHAHPARNMEERISDVRAQMAACARGVGELRSVIDRYGWDTVSAYMNHVQDNAEKAVKRTLGRLTGADGHFESTFTDRLDDGTRITVRITVTAGAIPPETVRAVVDFSGTGAEHTADSLNAPLPVTRSAVLYALRLMITDDIPLNSGCMKPVEIKVPEATVLNPLYPAPVSSGNVETSQRVGDVLLGAFGVAAASQGTMNNLLFEVEGHAPYYETIAGGSGASPGCPGASGVQVHMTNTRMTDPEVLESTHPGVRLECFTLRRASGGAGRYPGGDGISREIRFLRPAEVSVISERRVYAPYGAAGGGAGLTGENLLKKADGTITALPGRAFVRLEGGESVLINTPGGGGWGKRRSGDG